MIIMKKLILINWLAISSFIFANDIEIFVSPNGSNQHTGLQKDSPKKTIEAALNQVLTQRHTTDENIRVILLPGAYYLNKTIELGPELGPISIEADDPGSVTIKGSKIIKGKWNNHSENILKMKIDHEITPYSQLYINGHEQILARYPN